MYTESTTSLLFSSINQYFSFFPHDCHLAKSHNSNNSNTFQVSKKESQISFSRLKRNPPGLNCTPPTWRGIILAVPVL